MKVSENFQKLVGNWTGTNKLYMRPEDPARESNAEARIGLEARSKFLRINYEWTFDEDPQEGLMIFGFGKDSKVTSVWIDSFHQGDFMNCAGSIEENRISVKAHYTQPEYSDWAWRTIVDFINEDAFSFTMFNIEPNGTEHIAVEAVFSRA